jgi:hypothetical protein
MANETFTADQQTVLTVDNDGDGVIDPGEIVTTIVAQASAEKQRETMPEPAQAIAPETVR